MKTSFLLPAFMTSFIAVGGYHYTAETTVNDEGRKQKNTMMVEAWIDGAKARILFRENDNPTAKPGSYILTNDGGKTLYLVNPEDQNYMEWSMDMVMSMAGAVGGMLQIQFDNLKTEKLEESDGDRIHGFDTKRYKYKTSYDMNMKVLGMRRAHSVETEQESWVAGKLKDVALGVWLRNTPPSTGDEELDKLIEADMGKVQGFPLRSRTKTVTKQWNKKRTKVKRESISYSNTEVKTFKKTSIDGARFKIPQGYTMIDSPMGQGSPLKGLFKKQD
ncbi:MAG: DUF4412 domain-containing protein [Acidobacteriota bacterium]|nr:DUF4412 domain-containing protein [Acidobacteriota bacterium]